MQHSVAPWLANLFKGTVTLGLIGLLVNSVDMRRVSEHLRGTDVMLFLAALFVMMIQAVIAAFRWRLILNFKRMDIAFPKLVRFLWLGLFFNQLLPSSVGGDAVRGLCLMREGFSLGRASVAVLVDRMMGMAGLVLLVIAALPLSLQYLPKGNVRTGVLAVAGVAVAGIILVALLDRITGRLVEWRIARGMTALSREARALLSGRGPGLAVTGISVSIQILSIVSVAILAAAAEIEAAYLALVLVLPLATLLMTVPVSVAGWGVREGVMVIGLGYAGISADQALALSILYGLLLLVVALPGGFVWLLDGRRQAAKKKALGTE